MLTVPAERRRRIFALSLPIIGGMASQNLFNIVDTAMVGWLGDAALAAVGVGGFVAFAFQALVLGISTGVQSVAARRRGAGADEQAVRVLNSALLLILCVAPVLSVGLIAAAGGLFPLLNADPAVIRPGVPYLEWRLGAMVFIGINFAFRGYWNAMDMSRVYMSTLIATHACNVLLNWVLIFGNLGAPELGVTGAGMASALSLAFGSCIYVVLGFRLAGRLGFARGLGSRRDVASLIRISIPSSLQQMFFAAGLVAMFWVMGRIGTPEVAVTNVLITVTLFAILPGLGLGLACTTLVGQALGRNDRDDAHRWGWDVVRIAVVVMTTLGLPMLLVPDLVSAVFLHDESTRDLARLPMRLVGLLMPFEAVGFVLMHALLGAGSAKRVLYVSVVIQWLVFLPLAWLFGPFLGGGLLAVWVWQGATRALQAAVFAGSWNAGQWRTNEV